MFAWSKMKAFANGKLNAAKNNKFVFHMGRKNCGKRIFSLPHNVFRGLFSQGRGSFHCFTRIKQFVVFKKFANDMGAFGRPITILLKYARDQNQNIVYFIEDKIYLTLYSIDTHFNTSTTESF